MTWCLVWAPYFGESWRQISFYPELEKEKFPDHVESYASQYMAANTSKLKFQTRTKCVLTLLMFVNNQFDAQFFFLYLFIPIIYMFRATKCSSSGESIVSVRPLVYVTLCRWPCGMHTYIEWHIPEVVLIQLTLMMMSTWLLETCRELE